LIIKDTKVDYAIYKAAEEAANTSAVVGKFCGTGGGKTCSATGFIITANTN
jgi:hypothetical protein